MLDTFHIPMKMKKNWKTLLKNIFKKYLESLLYSLKKIIESKAGIGSIPDGFVLSFAKYKMNIQLDYKLKSAGIKELYKVLADIIHRDPEFIIIIDKKTPEIKEICETLPFTVKILVFETYYREHSNVPIHLFDTLTDYIPEPKQISIEKEAIVTTESKKTYSYGDETFSQILEVAELVFTQGKSYNEAVKIVAGKRKIHPATVRDKCTRRLNLTTSQFKDLLNDKEKLIAFLVERFPDKKNIINERLRR